MEGQRKMAKVRTQPPPQDVTALRLGFTVEEAARLAGVPLRTAKTWATTGFAGPTAPARADEIAAGLDATIDEYARCYGLGDLLRLRLARDLLDAGVDRAVVRRAVQELAEGEPWGIDPRTVADRRWSLVVVVDPGLLDGTEPAAPVVHLQEPHELLIEGDWRTDGAFPSFVYADADGMEHRAVLVYRLAEVALDLAHAVDRWRFTAGLLEAEMSPWVGGQAR